MSDLSIAPSKNLSNISSTTSSQKREIAVTIVEDTLHTIKDTFIDSISEENFSEDVSDLEEVDDEEDVIIVKRSELTERLKKAILKKRLAEMKNEFLNRKVTQYFRKKKIDRAFAKDEASVVPQLEERYEKLLDNYKSIKGKERSIMEECDKKINVLDKQMIEFRTEFDALINDFDQKLSEVGVTLIGAKTGELMSERTVKNILTRRKRVHFALSQERLQNIRVQRELSKMKEKSKQLDDLGDGLRMADFEQFRAETQNLSDKIEERNNDLNRLRLRCDADTQQLANIREKEQVLVKNLDSKKENFEDLLQEQYEMRDNLNSLKTKFGILRKNYSEMLFQCGILNRVVLLSDFDDTDQAVSEIYFNNFKVFFAPLPPTEFFFCDFRLKFLMHL